MHLHKINLNHFGDAFGDIAPSSGQNSSKIGFINALPVQNLPVRNKPIV